jgi:hypothetical protein
VYSTLITKHSSPAPGGLNEAKGVKVNQRFR